MAANQVEIILRLVDKTSKNAAKIGASLTRNLTLPIVAVGLAMLKTAADFDKTMTNLQARTGASAEDMERFRKTALDMGRDTAFSASQAADALLELSTSGFSAAESIATLPAVLNLAAAGQIELGAASDLTTDILKQYQLEIDEAVNVTDALAQAAQSSSADVAALGQGFQNVGAIANLFGLSVQETAASLATLAEAGIKGSEAGTALKSMLTNMTRDVPKVTGMWKQLGVSMFDVTGAVRPLDDVIDDLNVAMADFTDQERIRAIKTLAGSYGQTGLASLLAAGGIDEMLTAMEGSQTAAQVAEAQMDSFSGALNQLKGSLGTLSIEVMTPFMNNVLKPMVQFLTQVVNAFLRLNDIVPGLGNTIVALAVALAAIGPALLIWAKLQTVLAPLKVGFVALKAGVLAFSGILPAASTLVTAFGSALTFLAANPVILIGAAIAAFALLVIANFEKIKGAVEFVIDGFKLLFSGDFIGGSLGGAFEDSFIVAVILDIRRRLLDFKAFLASLPQKFFDLGKAIIDGLGQGILASIDALLGPLSGAIGQIANTISQVLQIGSPSKVTMRLGEQTGQGFIQGLENSINSGMGGFAPALPGMVAGGMLASPVAAGGGNTFHNTFILPEGTPREQAKAFMDVVANQAQRRGISGRSLTRGSG